MAKLSFGMMQSLDGYIDDAAGGLVIPAPDDVLFRHFGAHVASLAGIIYGRRMYEMMRYWDTAQPAPDARAYNYGAAWRAKPKWVASRTWKSRGQESMGPNATLISGDVVDAVRKLKAELTGEIEVAGPDLAGTLTQHGLIDEYRLYFRPFVLGGGRPFFAGARPPLRHVRTEAVGEDAVMLVYQPA